VYNLKSLAYDNRFYSNFQPKFLTKQEREAEALRRRQEEADAIRKRNDELRKKHAIFTKEAEQAVIKDDRERERERRERERDRHRREKEDPTDRPAVASNSFIHFFFDCLHC
jgi:ATP-dependent RNA helicase DDX23/PRP28